MSKEWAIILISAMTDFIIGAFGALTAAMLARGDAMLPSYPVLLVSFGTGAVSFARTVQSNMRRLDPNIVETTSVITTTTTPPPTGDGK